MWSDGSSIVASTADCRWPTPLSVVVAGWIACGERANVLIDGATWIPNDPDRRFSIELIGVTATGRRRGAAALERPEEAWLMTFEVMEGGHIGVWMIVVESTIIISSTINLLIWCLMAVLILGLARLSFILFLHKNLPMALQKEPMQT